LPLAYLVPVLLVRRPTPDPFQQATPDQPVSLPADKGAHFDAQTEWWYYTGHLLTGDGTRYGFELVFFKTYLPGDHAKIGPIPLNALVNPLFPAHFAITDEARGRFQHVYQANFPFPWDGGAAECHQRVWVNGWLAEAKNERHHLVASMDGYAIDLDLSAAKPPVLHGENGVVDMGGTRGGSYYYSYTDLRGAGTLTVDGVAQPVQATAWMDHQWGSWDWGAFQGWDWFSLRLDDGTQVMFSGLRDANQQVMERHQGGSVVGPDGTATPLGPGDFAVEVLERWQSPHTGASYPVRWRVRIPAHGLDVTITPVLLGQEVVSGSLPDYWEGSCTVAGTHTGLCYVEVTGY